MSKEALGLRPHSLELAKGRRAQASQRPPSAARGGGTGLLIDVDGGAIAIVLFYVRWRWLGNPARLLGVQSGLDLWGTGPAGRIVALVTVSLE
jgi:hypothetical protein